MLELVEIDRKVEERIRQAPAGRTACLDGFQLFARRDPAADIIDDLPERHAHGDLDETGVVDLADE